MAEEQYSFLATIKTGCEGVPKQKKIRIERWIEKLTAPAASSNASSRKNRDAYLSLLAMDVESGDLREPFDRLPPNGPLRTLPPHLPLRHALQLPRRRPPPAAAAQQRSPSAAARPPPSAPVTPHKTGTQRWSNGGSGGGGSASHIAAAAGGRGVRSSTGDVSAFLPRPPPPRFAGVRARSMSPLRRVEVEVACSTSSADGQRTSDDECSAAPPFGAPPPRPQQWRQQQRPDQQQHWHQQQEAGDMQVAAAVANRVRFGAAAGAYRAHAMSRLGTHEYLEYVEWFTGAARALAAAALRA